MLHGQVKKTRCKATLRAGLATVQFEGFNLLEEIRPIVLAQKQAGANFLMPRPCLGAEDLWQVVEATPLDIGRSSAPLDSLSSLGCSHRSAGGIRQVAPVSCGRRRVGLE